MRPLNHVTIDIAIGDGVNSPTNIHLQGRALSDDIVRVPLGGGVGHGTSPNQALLEGISALATIAAAHNLTEAAKLRFAGALATADAMTQKEAA